MPRGTAELAEIAELPGSWICLATRLVGDRSARMGKRTKVKLCGLGVLGGCPPL